MPGERGVPHYAAMPIPPVAEHTTSFDAGAMRLDILPNNAFVISKELAAGNRAKRGHEEHRSKSGFWERRILALYGSRRRRAGRRPRLHAISGPSPAENRKPLPTGPWSGPETPRGTKVQAVPEATVHLNDAPVRVSVRGQYLIISGPGSTGVDPTEEFGDQLGLPFLVLSVSVKRRRL